MQNLDDFLSKPVVCVHIYVYTSDQWEGRNFKKKQIWDKCFPRDLNPRQGISHLGQLTTIRYTSYSM